MKKSPEILVTGDIVTDNNIYKGKRQVTSSKSKSGTIITQTPGGAWLTYDILKHTNATVAFGLNLDKSTKLDQQAYAEWHKAEDGDHARENSSWYVKDLLGYNSACENPCNYSQYKKDKLSAFADLIIIDDGYLGFRNRLSKPVWPDTIFKKSSPWVLLKMTHPLGEGDLWNELAKANSPKLILILSVEDLRKESTMISKGLSWERTAGDLAFALRPKGPFQHLRRLARHIIVTIGHEGAFCIWDSRRAGQTQYRIFFDSEHIEGERSIKSNKSVIGNQVTFTAGLAFGLADEFKKFKDPNDHISVLEKSISRGIRATQHLLDIGHVQSQKPVPGFPAKELGLFISKEIPECPKAYVPNPDDETFSKNIETWTILENNYDFNVDKAPLIELARRIVMHGQDELFYVPGLKIKNFFTVDRNEIEALRNIQNLIIDYVEHGSADQPLSIAIFGPPGAGKSFAVKQIAKAGVKGQSLPFMVFNLSQFSDPADLIGALHQVRDHVLRGTTPFVFWDEFDAEHYKWLQYLLAPMQDGQFQEGQITHPIGKCIFFFAGATSSTLETFGVKEPTMVQRNVDPASRAEFDRQKTAYKEYKFKKGPDFVSRLHGYLNVLGPNPRLTYNDDNGKWDIDPADTSFPVRRALFMRGFLNLQHQPLDIDWGLLNALLAIPCYLNGSRSFSKLLECFKSILPRAIMRSNLPSLQVLSLCVSVKAFHALMETDEQSEQDRIAELLAPCIHASWMDAEIKPEAYNRTFHLLPMDAKLDNIAAAKRIQGNLKKVGLQIVPATAYSLPMVNYAGFLDSHNPESGETHLETLARREHEGWMAFRSSRGWTLANSRNDYYKRHPSMVEYDRLDPKEQDKDRNTVKKYAEMLELAGYVIIK